MAKRSDNRNSKQTVKKDSLFAECEAAKASIKKRLSLNKILGNSKAVQNLHVKIAQVADCDVNILISGESGSGKELVARAVHYLSKRAGKPFVPVNCGAIPENLFENELFGHVKGAFTGASFAQRGLVSEANGGTLFLDEIGTVAQYSQVKLLRLLQDKEYKPLGDSRPKHADIRIIAATNTNLLHLVNEGSFRDDLFYRLNVVPIHVPPLRERKEDIPILVDYFLNKYTREYDKSPKSLTNDVMKIFCSYSWPGNIRELENKVQQLVVTSSLAKIDSSDIELPVNDLNCNEGDKKNFNDAKKIVIDTFERKYLSNLLSEYKGDVASAAKEAGKNRTALWNLLKKHNISPKKFNH